MFIPLSFSPFRPLIIWLDTVGFSVLLAPYFIIFPTSFLSTLISFASNISLVFNFSRAYTIIGRTVPLYIFHFVVILPPPDKTI
jgi:hypothetical protein